MIAAYIVFAIVGGGLVLVSAFFGHGEHGGDSDAHLDADGGAHVEADAHGDAHGDAHIWLPFLSLRFWTYFAAVFGLVGLLLTKFTDTPEPICALVSGGTGFLVGLVVAYLMRVARRFEVDSSAKTQDFLGAIGKVVVAVRPGQEGKVRLNLKGDIIEVLALPTGDETLEIGSEAIIVSVENDRARVMSRTELLEETQINA